MCGFEGGGVLLKWDSDVNVKAKAKAQAKAKAKDKVLKRVEYLEDHDSR